MTDWLFDLIWLDICCMLAIWWCDLWWCVTEYLSSMGWVGLRELDPRACLVCSVSKSLSTAAASVSSVVAINTVDGGTQQRLMHTLHSILLPLQMLPTDAVAAIHRRLFSCRWSWSSRYGVEWSVQSTCFSVRDTGGLRKATDALNVLGSGLNWVNLILEEEEEEILFCLTNKDNTTQSIIIRSKK